MRMVIVEIGNWLFNAMKEGKEPKYSNSLGDAVRDGISLPNNPTNGDMIMTVFPNASITEIGGGSTIVVANDYKFNSTWWNAPYREDGDTE